jgi:uncharacterized membrane protein HdeD (DUF308 family)
MIIEQFGVILFKVGLLLVGTYLSISGIADIIERIDQRQKTRKSVAPKDS